MKSALLTTFRSKLNKGFTLIELLVVISIMAILSVIGMSVYSGVQSKARDAQRLDDARKIITVLEQYKSGTGIYPGTGSCVSGWCASSPSNGGWLPNIDRSNFINNNIPMDPINNLGDPDTTYYYIVVSSGQDYCLEIPQENNAEGNPYIRNPSTFHSTWRLRFGPQGPGVGLCSSAGNVN